jgi:hypothetical protein
MAGSEKRQLLIEALTDQASRTLNLKLSRGERSYVAEQMADRVIEEGWQWHPPKEGVLAELPPEEAAELFNEPGELTGESTPVVIEEVEWRPIEHIPGLTSFEISNKGDIRNKRTGRLCPKEYDIDRNVYYVKLVINTKPIHIDGPQLAKTMWREASE